MSASTRRNWFKRLLGFLGLSAEPARMVGKAPELGHAYAPPRGLAGMDYGEAELLVLSVWRPGASTPAQAVCLHATQVNRNGDSYDPKALAEALAKFHAGAANPPRNDGHEAS